MLQHRTIRAWWMACIVAGVAMLFVSAANAQSLSQPERARVQEKPIFSPLPTKTQPVVSQERGRGRSRLARAHIDRIPSPGSKKGETLTLNLFDDTVFDVVLERSDIRSPELFTWFGSIRGESSSRVILTVHDGIIAGNIFSDNGNVAIRRH